jgi:hypothetical protein
MTLLLKTATRMNSKARDLLRLGAETPPVSYTVEEGLARHRELAASVAPLPSWADKVGPIPRNAR